jgi:formate dehydrogenase maturation protein FdhE
MPSYDTDPPEVDPELLACPTCGSENVRILEVDEAAGVRYFHCDACDTAFNDILRHPEEEGS